MHPFPFYSVRLRQIPHSVRDDKQSRIVVFFISYSKGKRNISVFSYKREKGILKTAALVISTNGRNPPKAHTGKKCFFFLFILNIENGTFLHHSPFTIDNSLHWRYLFKMP